MKSFETLSQIISQCNKESSKKLNVDSESEQLLKSYCSFYDSLYDALDGNDSEITVNVDNNEVMLSIICGLFEVQEEDKELNQLLQYAKKFEVVPYDDTYMKMIFVFAGVWMSE